ncbi:hypothetical protein [Eubacterium xylanophilum]|uniref:hypothetical protein n=1 Tax=Eubacterium xylanophilum TaxID=39497 RepID=UPI00047AAF9F|nr:hypothetical protein [Eubacterium xylanophilum]
MGNTNAVKDPKNGVISCWVCTGVMIAVDLVRYFLLLMKGTGISIVMNGLVLVWVIISIVETVKYVNNKKKNG